MTSDDDEALSIVFVGDIMLARMPGEVMANGGDVFFPFAPFLKGDIVLGNLVCAVATSGEKVPKPFNFRANPAVLPTVHRYFSAVSIANNHTGDFGPGALVEMLGHLDSAELPYFGGGADLAKAHAPLVLEKKGIRIAFQGYSEVLPSSFQAGPETPGVAWSADDDRVVADIKAARENADLVIPFMHWGIEYHPLPSARQRLLAQKMIEAGADIVIGGHPHVTQGIEFYKGKLIVPSLGNFVFDRMVGFAGLGWLLRLTFRKTRLDGWETVPAYIDALGIPHPGPSAAYYGAVA